MWKYLKKYIGVAILASLFVMAEVSVDLYQPQLMAKIVNDGILGLNNGGTPDLDLVMSTGIQMILLVMLGGFCGVMCCVFTNLSAQRFGNDVRKAAFGKVMGFALADIDRFSAGSLITRLTSDVTQLERMLDQLVRGFVRAGMFFVAGTITLLHMDVNLGKVLLVAMPFLVLEIVLAAVYLRPRFLKLQGALDVMNTTVDEDVSAIRVIKAFSQEKRESERFDKANKNLSDIQFSILMLIAALRPGMNIILNLGAIGIIYLGAGEVLFGRIEPGNLIAAITYLSQILTGMMMIGVIFQTLIRGGASRRRLREVLDAETSISGGSGCFGEERGAVVFDHVSFIYPGQKAAALSDISFCVKPHETLAIIGATGSGKSTLVNLIPRFYDVTEGHIYVDGQDVRKVPLADLRSRISFVLQKTELFNTSIRENISMGRRGASMEEIRRAAELAMAEDFIEKKPEGYETNVSEGGMSLSGGQKQRIAIARALLKNSEILILDDATSALDFATEAKLRHNLEEVMGDVTKIIVAKRVSTVEKADRILVLENGHVAGLGTHEELLKNCAVYQEIVDSQKAEEVL